MKKALFLLISALIGVSAFASRDIVPGDEVLAKYYTADQVCVCIYVPADIACNSIIFTGAYNGWSSSVDDCMAFQAVEGYGDWYVTAFTPEENPDTDRGIQGKPIMLAEDGDFNWDYQVGAATVISGDVQVIEGGVANEIDLIYYGTDAPNVFTVDAWKSNPCTAIYHDYTVTVISAGCDSLVVPYIVGTMTDWSFERMALDEQLTAENLAPTYTYSFHAAEESPFQIVSGQLDETGAVVAEPAWEDAAYIQQLVDGEWLRMQGEDGDNQLTHSDVAILFDLRRDDLRWARCNMAEQTRVLLTVTFPSANFPEAGVEVIGTFDNWIGTTMAQDVETFSYYVLLDARETDYFMFRSAGSWDQYLETFDATNAEWRLINNGEFTFGELWTDDTWKGEPIMSIELDLSDTTTYRWSTNTSEPDEPVTTSQFGILVNGKTYFAGEDAGEFEGFQQYVAHVMVSEGDYCQLYDYETQAVWAATLNSSSVTGFDLSDDRYVASVSGCYDFYIKLKFESDEVYISEGKDCGNGQTIGGDEPVEPVFEHVQIGDLYYNLNVNNLTAEVTYQVKESYSNYFNEENPIVELSIPEFVEYNDATFTVTAIGEDAFYDLETLTKITIPSSVESIGWEAFRYCIYLESIDIPNSVTSIGGAAFHGCSRLTDISIGDNVQSIGNYVFTQCEELKSVDIPNSVTSIGDRVFSSCTNLTSVHIGKGLASIDNFSGGVFENCINLKEIVVDSENSTYDSRDNCNAIIETGTNTLIAGCSSTIIPNSVTSIGYAAFSGCTSLTNIEIPNSVSSIGPGAFNGCTGLTSIEIPNSVTSIRNGAIRYCSNLTSIVVESGNSKYDSRNNCNAIIETETNSLITGCQSTIIPNSVTVISEDAFSGCATLTSVAIPVNVTMIGLEAFWYCTGLTEITCEAVTPPTCGEFVFESVDKSIPLYVPQESISAYQAAEGWSEFTNILALSNDSTSGDDTATAYFINSQGWDVRAYIYEWKEDSWQTVTNDVTTTKAEETINGYEVYMYQFSAGLESPNFCFMNGAGSSADPSSRTAFQLYSSERPFFCLDGTIDSSGYANGTWYESPEAYLAAVNDTLPSPCTIASGTCGAKGENLTWTLDCEGVLTISGEGAMADWDADWDSGSNPSPWKQYREQIKTLNIEEGVMSIGNYAFMYFTNATNVLIPESLNRIGDWAFAGCSDLTSIYIPDGVTSIGEDAFDSCTGLNTISIGKNVTDIGWGAFGGCSSLTSIDIPSGVTSIGSLAFARCSNLSSIVVDENNSVFDSRDNCNGVIETSTNSLVIGCQSTIIPASVTSISNHAFYQCLMLESITIPFGITSIGNEAFYQCYSLTSIVVEDGNSSYDSRENCNAIIETESNTLIVGCQSTIIPNTVTSIGKYAFYGCYISSVNLPNSVTSIGEDAFASCGITSVTIPNSVTNIGRDAFSWNNDLEIITCHATTPPTCAGEVFSSIDKSIPLYVPEESIDAYKAADGWSEFTNILAIGSEPIETEHVLIGDLYYNLDIENMTAEVTYHLSDTTDNYAYLSDIVIPESVEYDGSIYNVASIGDSAFCLCPHLTSIEIPNSITDIKDCAFHKCTGLTRVEIPNSVTSIGHYAFHSCSDLNSILIGNSVTDISRYVFTNCPNLTNLIVEDGNPEFDSRDNCNAIIETSSNTLILGCPGTIIPNSVTSIGTSAFAWCPGLTSIDIPDGVLTIGEEAFEDCYDITNVTIGNNVTSIGDRAFSMCRGLHSILIPNSVKSIGEMTFYSCSGIRSLTIGNNVTNIGESAFRECYIDTITCYADTPPTCGDIVFNDVAKSIPLYVPEESIDAYKAAEGWSEFTNILAIGAQVEPVDPFPAEAPLMWPIQMDETTRDKYADNTIASFYPNDEDRFLYIWDSSYRGGETEGLNFFGNNDGYLAAVVTAQGWSGLGYNLTDAGNSWQDAETLRQAIVANPENYYLHLAIKSTDSYSHSFYTFNSNTTQFTLGDHSINDAPVYSDFPRDGEWHDFFIPMTYHAAALAEVTAEAGMNLFVAMTEGVDGAQLNLDAVFFCNEAMRQQLTQIPDTITPEPILSVPYECAIDGDFADWESVPSEILAEAYADENSKYEALRAIKFFTNIDYIYFYLEYDSTSYKYTEDGKEVIGSMVDPVDIFMNVDDDATTGYSSWLWEDSGADYLIDGVLSDKFNGGGLYAFDDSGDHSEWNWIDADITSGYTTTVSDKVLLSNGNIAVEGRIMRAAFPNPDQIKSLKVGVATYYSDWSGESGSLPQTTILDEGSKPLPMLEVPLNNGSSKPTPTCPISGICGAEGENLVWTLDCEGVLTISGEGAMDVWEYGQSPWEQYKESITTIVFEGDVTSIADYAFNNCTNMTNVEIPNNVTYIGQFAFAECTSLTRVDIPDNVTIIEYEAFYDCNGLTNVTIGNSVTRIGAMAFAHCYSLTSLVLPSSITSLDYEAFFNCKSLTSITCEAITPPTCGENVFNYVDMTIPLYVPEESVEAYKAADGWSEFTNILAIGSEPQPERKAYWYWAGYVNGEDVSSPTEERLFNEGVAYIEADEASYLYVIHYTEGDTVLLMAYMSKEYSENSHVTMTWSGNEKLLIPAGKHTLYLYDNGDGTVELSLEPLEGKTLIGDDLPTTDNCQLNGWCGIESDTIYWDLDCNGVLTISGNGMMQNWSYGEQPWFSRLEAITAVVIEEGVTNIGSAAFYGCTGMTTIVLPSTLTQIGIEAFVGCQSLSSIVCYAVNPPLLEEGTFVAVDYHIPLYVPAESVEAYKNAANWSEFTNIVPIGTEITYYLIGSGAALGSWDLERALPMVGDSITLALPASAYEFKILTEQMSWDYALDYNQLDTTCSSEGLEAGTNDNIKFVLAEDGLVTIKVVGLRVCVTGNFGGEVAITGYSLVGDSTLFGTEWDTENTLTEMTLQDDGSWIYVIDSVELKEGANYQYKVTANHTWSVEQYPNDTDFYSISVEPSGVYSVVFILVPGEGATATVNLLHELVETPDCPYRGVCGDSLVWELNCDGELIISGTGDMSWEDNAPWLHVGHQITSLVLSEGITSIGAFAFGNCVNLTSVTIPNSVRVINLAAFNDCTGLESVDLGTGVDTIYDSAFLRCSNLTSIVIPESVDTIGQGAFNGCDNLTSVTINSASVIEKDGRLAYTFGFQLQEIVFGEGATRIGSYKLYYPNTVGLCKLRSITFPATVTEIGEQAFYGTHLDELYVPEQVTVIGEDAFKSIKQVWYDGPATGAPWGAQCINDRCVTYQSIDVTDNSLDEWDNLPEKYVFEAKCPVDATMHGLKSMKVFADPMYINLLVEPNMDDVTDLEWVPFHVIINTDNSDETGGYGDEFTDANTDILLEGALFSENEPTRYDPLVYKWWGEVGANGWDWTDPNSEPTADNCWGAIVCEGQLPISNSQYVDGKFEIQLLRELIPADWNETEFGIGIDIQQDWMPVGILPIASPTEDNPNGYTKKLTVRICDLATFPVDTTVVEPCDTIIVQLADTITEGEVYLFGESELTEEGTYEMIFKTENDCDSTVILNLTVIPYVEPCEDITIEIVDTISAGETYLFGGRELTLDGIYIDSLRTVNGCDSIVILNLTVIPVVDPCENITVEIIDSIAEGESYEFGTMTLTEEGTYIDTLKMTNGCDSIVILTLTFTVPEVQETVVIINGVEIVINDSTGTTETEVDILGDSTLVYNTEENTLTISNLTLETDDSTTTAISYTGTETLTIVLTDSSTIVADTVITSTADVIITGEGTLVAEGVVPIIGVPEASILFDSVTMYVHSLSSHAAVRRRIRGIIQIEEDGGPALSGFGSVDFNKTGVTPPDAMYGPVDNSGITGIEGSMINAMYTLDEATGEINVLTELILTAIADSQTAVPTTRTSQALDPNQPMYNILGLRVGEGYTGIVIQNGQTYILQ